MPATSREKTFTISTASRIYFRAQRNNQNVFFKTLFAAVPGKTVEFALGGAFGGGKSKCGAAAVVGFAEAWRGSRILVCRKDLTDLKDTFYRDFVNICPPQMIRTPRNPLATRETMAKDVLLRNGSRIMFRELKDLSGKLSLEINMFVIEQGEEITFDVFRLLVSRLRPWPGAPPSPFVALTTFNPYNGWGKDRYVKPPAGKKIPPNAHFIKLSPLENIDLLTAKSDYIDDLRSKFPDSWMKRFIEGNWDVPVEGAVFPEFDPERHVLTNFKPAAGWPRVQIIDPHYAKPFVTAWACFVPGGPTVIYDECEGDPSTAPVDFLVRTQEIGRRHGAMRIDVAVDFALAGMLHKKNEGRSLRQMFVEAQIPWRPVSKGSKIDQILRLKNALTPGRKERPRFFVASGCVKTIDQLMCYHWRDSGPKVEPEKVNDDYVDCAFYALSERRRLEPSAFPDVRDAAWEGSLSGEPDVRERPRIARPLSEFDDARRSRMMTPKGNGKVQAVTGIDPFEIVRRGSGRTGVF